MGSYGRLWWVIWVGNLQSTGDGKRKVNAKELQSIEFSNFGVLLKLKMQKKNF